MRLRDWLFIPLLAGSSLSLSAQAVAASPVDLNQMKSTNVYAMLPQQRIFVEFPLGVAGPVELSPLDVLGGAIAHSMLYPSVYRYAEAEAKPIHTVLDGFDADGLFKQAVDKTLKNLPWLHASTVLYGKEDSPDKYHTTYWAGTSDSVMLLDTYYSITPDYRGVVVALLVKLYSSALSPEKASPFDSDSKYYWLKQPVIMRAYVYQSKLLQLPQKTQAVIDQLSSEVDQDFDAPDLKRKIARLNANPMDEQLFPERKKIADDDQDYQRFMADVKDPAWQRHDSRLMYSLMWSADGAALLKQALQDGADALQELVPAGLGPLPAGAKAVARDAAGKASVYVISQAQGRTVYMNSYGVVFSAADGDPLDLGTIVMLYTR